jgi:subtilisin family serine protease
MQRIRAAEAHAISRGNGVIVAILDSGVDYNHPDLTDHILRDASQNVIGFDFVDGDNDPMDEANGIDDDGDVPELIDEGFGHGTHVAGIIALVAPEAKILPVRVLDSEGAGDSLSIYEGILFALEQGATVINLSLGMSQKAEAIEDAIELAFGSHSSDFEEASVVASAGNNGNSSDHYPAAQGDNMIAVTATDPNDIKADFSNFNSWVDISAPGVGIYSTYPNGQYATWDGTSMSAPFVSGLTALLRSLDPGDSPGHVREVVQLGADFIYGINPAYKKKKKLGAGRLNLLNSLLIENDADPLAIKKAIYKTGRQKLVIRVDRKNEQGDTSVPVLTVEGLGNMTYDPARNRYTFKLQITNPPSQVTILSSEGLMLTGHIVPVD